jgi:anhydro-N-acetylmuramic acid kinase
MLQLQKIAAKKERLIIGLMSGTSCDGLDIALFRVRGCGTDTGITVLKSVHQPYTGIQRDYLLGLMDFERINVRSVSNANFYLAQIWSQAVLRFLKANGYKSEDIDLIGSHGQTVYHQPDVHTVAGRRVRSTLQIGDPAALAQLTGITTVGDFRVADMALGGQAAPLVPYFDWLLYSKLRRNVLALNIGGIANVTYIPADGDLNKVTAFDTGPGNMLIDQLMMRPYEVPFDKNGARGKLGTFSDRLYNFLVRLDGYPGKKPPKSTGREHYGESFVIELLRKAVRWRIPEPDVINTVTTYTAITVKEAWAAYIKYPVDLIIAGGGGSHNRFLMQMLQEYFPQSEIRKAGSDGVDADYKEAICFGVLANELISGNTANMPQVTGAAHRALLGKICPV